MLLPTPQLPAVSRTNCGENTTAGYASHTHTHANGEPLSDVVSKLFTAVILLWDVLGDYHKAIYSYIMLLPQLSNKKLLGL